MVGRSGGKRKHLQGRSFQETRLPSQHGPPQSTLNKEPVTPISESSCSSRASTIPPLSHHSIAALGEDELRTDASRKSTGLLPSTFPGLSGRLHQDTVDEALHHVNPDVSAVSSSSGFIHGLSSRDEDNICSTNFATDFEYELTDADLVFDQRSIPHMSGLLQDPLLSPTPNCESPRMSGIPRDGVRTTLSNSTEEVPKEPRSQEPNLSHSLERFPHILALCKIIAVLEEHIYSEASSIDEVMRVNKTCMTQMVEIMDSELNHCKSFRMLVLTAMDLVLTLYDATISENVKSTSQLSQTPSQTNLDARSVSLQFGSFQFDAEDMVTSRNQIIRNELDRCVKVIQERGTELCSPSAGSSRPDDKIQQQLFAFVENRARRLAISLS